MFGDVLRLFQRETKEKPPQQDAPLFGDEPRWVMVTRLLDGQSTLRKPKPKAKAKVKAKAKKSGTS